MGTDCSISVAARTPAATAIGSARASSQVSTVWRLSSRCAVKNTSTAAPQAMASGVGSAIQNTGFRSSRRSRTVPPPRAVRLARNAKPTRSSCARLAASAPDNAKINAAA
jgi:hypothetical protein